MVFVTADSSEVVGKVTQVYDTWVQLLNHFQDFTQVHMTFLITLNLLMVTSFYVRTSSTFYCLGLYGKICLKSTRDLRRDFYVTVNYTLQYCGVFTPCKNCNIETRSRDTQH
jgi:hypothetical protein